MTECGRCGDCCEDLELNFTKKDLRAFLLAWRVDAGGPVSARPR